MKEEVYQHFIQMKQTKILNVLIRELQQYMMSMNSGTTDSSMLNSDNLDKLSAMLNAKKISFEDTTKAICDFAHNSFDIKLDYKQII